MKHLSLLIVVLLAAAPPAWGFGGLFRRSAPVVRPSYYYYSTPIQVAPTPLMIVPPAIPVYPAPAPVYPAVTAPVYPAVTAPPIVVQPPPFAAPSVAPPSRTPEPPEMPPASTTSLRPSQRYFDFYPTAGRATSDRPSVAFWNLTSRALTLRVNGQTHVLRAGQSTTLDLPRSFRWEVDGRATEAVQLATSDGGAEVLIRR